MDASEAIRRWDGFLANIDRRVEETLAQAEQGCAMLLEDGALDPLPMSNAWTAIEDQLRQLAGKITATWLEKVEPWLEDAARRRVELDKGTALRGAIETRTLETECRVFAGAARRILQRAKENLARERTCTQCRAPLSVSDRFFRAVHVSCPYCTTLNTFIPGTKVQEVEWFCCHHLARQKALPSWFAWRSAAEAMKGEGFERWECLRGAEQALLAHTRAYLHARIEIVPELEKDFERDLAGRMASFYAEVASSRAWVLGDPRSKGRT